MYVSDFPGGIADKNPPANTGDMGMISGPGRLEKVSAKQRRTSTVKNKIKKTNLKKNASFYAYRDQNSYINVHSSIIHNS